MKKVLSLILAFVFVVGICASAPITITANADGGIKLKVQLNDEGTMYQVISCNRDAKGEIVIPNTYNGLPITYIAESAFKNCDSITHISIPDSITGIGVAAFRDCDSLVSIKIPESVKEIGSCALADCGALISVKLPNSITTLSAGIFSDCSMLETIDIPSSITSIGFQAFSHCTSLKCVTLPDNLESIDQEAFVYCTSLDKVEFGNNVNDIGSGAFAYCESLVEVEFGGKVDFVGAKAFYNCKSLENVKISKSVEFIDWRAFYNCYKLLSVVIPKNVTSIGQEAFGYKYNSFTKETEKIEGFTIYGKRGSEAENYANNCNFNFVDDGVNLDMPIVKLKNTAKGIELTWNEIANAEYYVVGRGTYDTKTGEYNNIIFLSENYKKTAYIDTSVRLGETYTYAVFAVNGDEVSESLNLGYFTYNVTPTVKVAVASNGIKVSWSTAANATGYTVYSSTYNTKTKKWSGWKNRGTVKASKTSWTDKSVKSGTQYKYTIRAVNGKVLSSYNKTGAATLYLAQPTVKIANASTGVKVSWNKVTGATGYTVYRSEYKNGAWTKWASRGTAKANKTSWTDTKVASGVQYKYTVRAINGKVASTYVSSNTVLYLAQPKTTVKAVSNGINVGWTQSTGATGYTVYRMEYNTKTKKWSGWKKMGTAKSSKTNWTDKSAKRGVQYKYTVKAVNGKAASTYKASSSVKR